MKPRVLIVDDERSMCELLETDLRLRDFEPTWHTSATEAVETLSDVQHEVLLSKGRFGREGEFVVPAGHYFMMGDNSENSTDSREYGPIPLADLTGRVDRIFYPRWE